MLSEAVLSGELDADRIAQHLDAKERWLGAIARDPHLMDLLARVVSAVEAGDPVIVARLVKQPELGARLFALAPAMSMLRIFNAIEEHDPQYVDRSVVAAQSLRGRTPIHELVQARFGFLRMVSTLARVVSRRSTVPVPQLPMGV